MKIRKLAAIAAAFFTFLPTALQAQGYQVQPMLASIEPTGSGSHLTMSITNTGAVTITLEFIPFRATVDNAGTPNRVDEDADLMVYPAQAAIEPGDEQAIQLRYVGDPALSEARMYGVRISQLPVSAPGFSSGNGKAGASSDVKISFNFLSHIIVSPPSASATMSVKDAGRAANGDLNLRIENNGNGIAVLNASEFTLTDEKGTAIVLAADDLSFGDFSAFMPNQARDATVRGTRISELFGAITPTLLME